MRKLRKAYQRKLNQQIRAMNKNIANDILWMGRFEFRQKEASFEEFSDGSGGILIIILRGYDKITGYYKDFRFEFAPWLHSCEWKLWEIANNFIVNDTKVWESEPHPNLYNGFVTDCTHIHIPNKVMKEPYNFYLTYDHWKERVQYVSLCGK